MTANGPARADAESSRELTAILVSRWPGASATIDESLGTQLEELHRTAASAWPDLEVDAPRFIEYLAERLDGSRPAAQALAEVEVADLYLACACAARVPAALAAFESQHLSALAPIVARVDASPAFIDEVTQAVRIRLLVGNVGGDSLPAILQYRGKGPLRGWLSVVATRTAMSLKRHGPPRATLEEAVLQASLDNPELQSLHNLYLDDLREVIRAALSGTLASLAPESRNLLRWHLLQGVSLRKIAGLRNTHVMTVAREYARIRSAIHAQIRQQAQARLGLGAAEADSLVAALASRISITISRLFDGNGDGGQEP